MTVPKALDAPYESPRIFGPAYRTSTLGILLVVTLVAFEAMSIGAVMPAVSADLRAFDLYGWSFSAFLMAALFANVAAGLWSDRRGHATPFVLGVALFAGGMALAGSAPDKWLFIVARAVQGLGGGAVIVATYVMIAKVYVPDARAKIFAALSAAWVLPALVGPGIAGFVADSVGWRWVFFGIIPLVVPALLMLLSALRDGPAGGGAVATGPRSRPVAMTLAAAATSIGTGVLLFGIGALHTRALLGGFAVAVGLVVLGLGLPRLLPRRALRFGRGLPTTIMMRGLLAGSFFAVNSFIPLFLHDVRGFSTTAAGVALTTGALGWSAGSYLQSRRSHDRIALVGVGSVAVLAGILLTLLMVVPGVTGWVAVPAWIVAGFGMGLGITSVSVVAMQQSPDAEQGANSAALQVMDGGLSALTIGLGGALINLIGEDELTLGFTVIVVIMAALAVFTVVVSARMRPRPAST